MFSRAKIVILMLMLAMGVLVACAGGGDIPPCTPVEGSDVDPCEAGAGHLSSSSRSALLVIGPSGDAPTSIQAKIEGSAVRAIHLVVRATYVPGTVRCTMTDIFRAPPFLSMSDGGLMLRCYSDIRVNEYLVGSGPAVLTVVVAAYTYKINPPYDSPEIVASGEQHRRQAEFVLVNGGETMLLSVPPGGFGGREKILFLGLELDYSIETFKVRSAWDVVRSDDGTVLIHHTWRDYWLEKDAATYRSQVEWTLPAFDTAVTAAHNARIEKYDGRIASGTQYPRVIANASNLHQAYVETGAVNHPDGPPERDLPPACGLAVPDYTTNPGLVRDCETLLGLKDTLRGDAALNWSVDVAMADWDGVRTRGTGRVTDIILVDKGLTGTVPAELGNLSGLQHLWLNINQLTGTIPPELGSMPAIKSLLLNDNRLTGPIPTELGNLTTLESLWLQSNQLSGAVPSQLAQLINLEKLTLSSNALTGEIPSGIGGLSKLEILWLSHNQLTGNVPSELGNLSKLRKLTLSNNQLTGAIPTSLGELADTLTELRMANNAFTGCIPPALRSVATNDLDRLGLSYCSSPES